MACGYISSNDNRMYVAAELTYGQVAAIQSTNRIPAVKLTAKQQLERPKRKDKTGTRTYPGTPAGLRKKTSFDLTTYMTGWTSQTAVPAYGPLFAACTGGTPMMFAGGTAAADANTKLLSFAAAHQLSPGQAVTFGGELRFVSSIVDAMTVELNAPFSTTPSEGSPVGPTVTYQPGTTLGSVSLFDYWGTTSDVQRILSGGAVDTLKIKVNADYHEFEFSGSAADLIDSASFAGEGGLAEFPPEPALDQFDSAIIPGHLGEAWLGDGPDRFYTITSAEIAISNDIQMRSNEFGLDGPRCISAGMRTVTADIQLYEISDDATQGLYQAARQVFPIGVMFQLGQQAGQLFGVYLKSVVPEVPEFDDSDTRLQWRFSSCRAQGTEDDEVYIAFG
jgi:hypothetical protein